MKAVTATKTIATVLGATILILAGLAVFLYYYPSTSPTLASPSSIVTPPQKTVAAQPTPPPSDLNQNGCYTTATALKHVGEIACVDFHVGYVFESSRGDKYIDEFTNYSTGMGAYIPSDSPANIVDLSQYMGKDISVSGMIANYKGAPQIVIATSSQLSIYK